MYGMLTVSGHRAHRATILHTTFARNYNTALTARTQINANVRVPRLGPCTLYNLVQRVVQLVVQLAVQQVVKRKERVYTHILY